MVPFVVVLGHEFLSPPPFASSVLYQPVVDIQRLNERLSFMGASVDVFWPWFHGVVVASVVLGGVL